MQIDCRRVDGSGCPRSRHWGRWGLRVTTERKDGVVQEIRPAVGDSIEVGELAVGDTWEAKVVFGFGILAEDDVEAFRLYFKASAWNANPDSASVLARLTGTEETLPETATPTNDRFASSTTISGIEGTAELDLIGAQAEPGEPLFSPWRGRPAGSVWYEWTAPSDDMVSFSVTPDAAYGSNGHGAGGRVSRRSNHSAGACRLIGLGRAVLRRFGTGLPHPGSATPARWRPLVMSWSLGPRPANDDFAAAAVLEDTDGSTEVTNAGATLEPGEFFGDLAATVWYQWTAPERRGLGVRVQRRRPARARVYRHKPVGPSAGIRIRDRSGGVSGARRRDVPDCRGVPQRRSGWRHVRADLESG